MQTGGNSSEISPRLVGGDENGHHRKNPDERQQAMSVRRRVDEEAAESVRATMAAPPKASTSGSANIPLCGGE